MYPTILYGPESEPYTSSYLRNSPAPPNQGPGGDVAYLYPFPLGKQLVLEDGRKFRFASVGGSTLVIGNVLTGPVNTSSQQNLDPASGAVGDRIGTMTTGASSALNTFAEGFLNVSVTPGAAQFYKIGSHALMTTAAGDTVNLAPGHALRSATLAGTSKYDLLLSVYKGVKQVPTTTLTAPPVGVALVAQVTLEPCWVQTRGMAAVLTSDGTGNSYIPIAGTRAVVPSATRAGAVQAETSVAGTSKIQVTVGITHYAAADGAWSTIFLTLDG